MSHAHLLTGKSVLVTGAAGCIGAWVVKLLHEAGAKPVVFDIVENRQRLDLIMEDADAVTWECGDITDYDRLSSVCAQYSVAAIIHLAALQVPFCKADPVGSTQINVMGSINILEVARQQSISRLSYASSIAAPAMTSDDALSTLYGAHKVCGEQMAAVYWQDWGVPSVGIRPGIIYGPGRDQGMSAAPTIAMLAASAGRDYETPFTGDVAFVHVEDAAQRFIAAAAKSYEGAHVFDMNGSPASVDQVLDLVRGYASSVTLTVSGEPMPFPADDDDGALDALLQIETYRSIDRGVQDTMATFEAARSRGISLDALFSQIMEKHA